MPQRIQRKRTKGWRMPEGAVYVGRPSKFGNPFTTDECLETGYAITEEDAREVCTGEFRAWLQDVDVWPYGAEKREYILTHIHELKGKDLACFCPLSQACHADVLLELANK